MRFTKDRWGILVGVLGFTVVVGLAQATPISVNMTSSNGEGSFDPTIACPAGDGPSWRYAYSGAASAAGEALDGTWNSTIEVHDAGNGMAYIPDGTGRFKIAVDRGGDANFEFDGGDCTTAPLALGVDGDGDPLVSGSLPAQGTGGSGAARGFTGSGTVSFSLELGPGADNLASMSLSGDWTVLQPSMQLGTVTAYWRNLSDYLNHRLSVIITIRNGTDPTTAGDAFAVTLTKARLSSRVPIDGVPRSFGRIDADKARTATVRFPNTRANRTYTVKAWVEGTDSLDDPFGPLILSGPVTSPPPP